MEIKKFIMEGTKNDAILALHHQGIAQIEDAEKLLNYLLQNQELLDDDETVEIEYDTKNHHTMNLTLFDGSLYVSLKTVTIVIIASLLDIALTKGFASTALSLFGSSSTAFARIIESNGEKCILKETLTAQQRIGTPDILKKYNQQCCYPTSACKFRDDEKCKCTEDDIVSIYDELCKKNVFKKSTEGQSYLYQW